ncbi:MAG: hypothetical protein NTX01_03050 [Candidatus Omnitrophica bacterium]|nr:hypothetical protein [Candidatus Omnitrophota bacterium]
MKKPVLVLLAIMIILAGSVIANAQNEAQNAAKQSWFDSFIGFFKTLFVKMFNIEEKKGATINEQGNQFNKAAGEKEKTEVADITNVTCGDCQYFSNHTCLNYTCCKNDECLSDKVCISHECETLNCVSCQYADNHSCLDYECCKDTDCAEGKVCGFNKCMEKGNLSAYTVPFEKLVETGRYGPKIIGYDFPDSLPHLSIPVDPLLGEGSTLIFAVIRSQEDFVYVKNNVVPFPSCCQQLYFSNYFLVLLSGHLVSGGYFFTTEEVTATQNKINILFSRGTSDYGNDAESLFMIKKSDLIQGNNLDFVFIDSHNRSLTWTIHDVDIDIEEKCPPCDPPYISPTTGNICEFYYCNASTHYANDPTKFFCVRKLIQPCCGNNECEISLGENEENCPVDCQNISKFLYCETDENCAPCCQNQQGKCMNINYSCSDYPTYFSPNLCGKDIQPMYLPCGCVNNQCMTVR